MLTFLVLAGASNGVNLTDGLDGLAAGCCAIVFLAYLAITITTGQEDLALLSACFVGASRRLPLVQRLPGLDLHGGTGSLGLGGAIGGLAMMTQTEVLLIILGGIFVIEALSVAIQVFAFKTFRRRVFLMAPVHHHFEMMAWSETKIMLRFWIVGRSRRHRIHALPELDRELKVALGGESRAAAKPAACLADRRPPLPEGPSSSSAWRARGSRPPRPWSRAASACTAPTPEILRMRAGLPTSASN